jgi:hypothetical protein
MTKLSDQITAALKATDSGVYLWTIASNSLSGDGRIAEFFQLPKEQVAGGLPVERYLERIHVDDRPRTARAIHDAILTGEAYQENYRIVHKDGSYFQVLAVGHCFRDQNGMPSAWCGVLYDMTAKHSELPMNAVTELCLAAYGLVTEGQDSVIHDTLGALLEHMGQPVAHKRKKRGYTH